MDLELGGKSALVTGSSRGTGLLIARRLAGEGARVIVHGLLDGEQTVVAQAIRDDGGTATAVTGDITTDDGARRLADEMQEAVDIVVNNFGQAAGGSWSDATADEWVDAYQKNLLSAVRVIKLALPGMKRRGWGRIIQVATIGATRPAARMPHYYAAKAALVNATVSLSKELLGSGVTANVVSPGLIHTPETEQYLRYIANKKGWDGDWASVERRGVEHLTGSDVGRMARGDEVGDLIAFLSSPRANYINGVHLRIDGGATATVL